MPFLDQGTKKEERKARSAGDRRIAEKAGTVSLPKPQMRELTLDFEPEEGLMLLDGRGVEVDRKTDHNPDGYQREYEDSRARRYGENFNWALFGTPILSLRDDGKYWGIVGQHRLAAAGYAGIRKITCAVYEGLRHDQEAYIFNQEDTQRRSLTALYRFHSGVQAGFADHLIVKQLIEQFGEQVAIKSSPRLSNIGGVTPVDTLLTIYDFIGEEKLDDALTMIWNAWGRLRGQGIDAALFSGMAQFLAIYDKGSKYGVADRKRFLNKLKEVEPIKLRKDASAYDNMGATAARFMALVDLYNYKTFEKNRLEFVRPDWRKCGALFCTYPGCDTGLRKSAGRTYRRSLCRKHYNLVREAEHYE